MQATTNNIKPTISTPYTLGNVLPHTSKIIDQHNANQKYISREIGDEVPVSQRQSPPDTSLRSPQNELTAIAILTLVAHCFTNAIK